MKKLIENRRVQVRFLLGPAGTGKTYRCLEEIRADLKRSPEGPPLLFLAPKQATFQIERQLLSDPGLAGYTRLQILSFDRLAKFALETLGGSIREILSEEGRVMIVRALLAKRVGELKVFRSTARLPGFAQQLAALLREFQHQQLAPQRLREMADVEGSLPVPLRNKLSDVADIFSAYREWLTQNDLEDAGSMLELAAEVLKQATTTPLIGGAERSGVSGCQLWMDGFAEMTPQELELLAAIIPCCERATLAFCLEREPVEERESWLSLWTVVGQTCRRVRQRISEIPGAAIQMELLARTSQHNRFSSAPMLRHLEAEWARGGFFTEEATGDLSLVSCSGVEAEATFAAREICRFVQSGGRYRECAVLMRTLDGYHDVVRRTFTRFGIPMFLDRREPVAHHPLAELTRFALRIAAYGWQSEDWFGALKTGLVHNNDEAIDELENEALAKGWEHEQWTNALPPTKHGPHRLERVRERITPPFISIRSALKERTTGPQLATAVRKFWAELKVDSTLENWAEEAREVAPLSAAVHGSVLEQIEAWLTNVERAFVNQSLTIMEWLPILEAGLASLSVGVIPPALDQVLVGTIDRSRNPDLRLGIVIGLNETVFPAPPSPPPILTESERECFADALVRERKSFALSRKERLAHERYYGYIACTRSRERLVLTWSQSDAKGRALNPSPFISLIERLFPRLQKSVFSTTTWTDAEHLNELAPHVLRSAAAPELRAWTEFSELIARADGWRAASSVKSLAAEIASRLYENPFRTSVSALEQFAACPFKFFLSKGLGLEEREEFEVDARERGKFQHEILSEFHLRATQSGRRWRDLPPGDAKALIREIGNGQLTTFADGLFNATPARRFTAELLISNLEHLAATLVGWMTQYHFDPQRVELAFGFTEQAESLPGWNIDLGNGRSLVLCGRVDRVDLCDRPDGQGKLAVVIDYKSSGKKVDATKLHHGLELQLLSYLGWLKQLDPSALDATSLTPAGVFYVALRGSGKAAASRAEAMDGADEHRRKAFQHAGRFDDGWRTLLSANENREQFNLRGRSDPCDSATFARLVDDVEQHLRVFGRRILDGFIEIAPYRKSSEMACEQCEFLSVCRFDSWTQPYRILSPPPKPPPPQS